MKLTPNTLGLVLGKVEQRVTALELKLKVVEHDNMQLAEGMNRIKDIIDNMLTKDNPHYRKKRVLDEMDGFLRNPIGRTRPIIEN